MPTSEQLVEWTASDRRAQRLITRIRTCVAERHGRERLHESDSFVSFRKLPLELQKHVVHCMDCNTQWNLTQTCTELRQFVIRPHQTREPHLVTLKAAMDCLPFTKESSEFEVGQADTDVKMKTEITVQRGSEGADIGFEYDDDEYLVVNKEEWYLDWDILLGHPCLRQPFSMEVRLTGSGGINKTISEWYDLLPIALWEKGEMQIWIQDEKNANNSCIITKDRGPDKFCSLDTKLNWCQLDRDLCFDWSEMPLGYKWAILFVRESDQGNYEGLHRVWSKDAFDVEVVRQLYGFLWRRNSIIPKKSPEHASQ